MCYKPPLLFNVVWKAVGPFVDPHTRDKLVFLSPKSPPGEPRPAHAAASTEPLAVAVLRWRRRLLSLGCC